MEESAIAGSGRPLGQRVFSGPTQHSRHSVQCRTIRDRALYSTQDNTAVTKTV